MIKEHYCDAREEITEANNCAWIVYNEDQKIWLAKCINGFEFAYDLEIIHCPYCGAKLE